MNTYDERTRLILSEIGRVTVGLLASSEVNKQKIVTRLQAEAKEESNPARKSILDDAITFLNSKIQ
ncbi:hypothetical protein REJ26_000037 [Providencia stuartii]|uniref:Uncharacterized protein n=2 Tax=Providencia TaxID=586 RepID=A0A1S1HRQ8_PROST|nr:MULTISPECIES: hypothetical protein [Providencia]MDV5224683.1 hypothetical protein [Providencia rettgeri]ELR5080756.1 hypothetical protein [Providencia stuartii]ELR5111519.1 hypothetical protein [Providencia stuartii]ELR5298326.1 hypothetical protein [Providencia stuartii]MDW7586773.1 hypothetical protein [Providencia sp. 2023EL-00965]